MPRIFSGSISMLAAGFYLAAVAPLPVSAAPASANSVLMYTPQQASQQVIFDLIDASNFHGLQQYLASLYAEYEGMTDLQSRMNPDFVDPQGSTPLIHAARQPDVNIMRYLVDHGANLNTVNARGETALVAAYNTGNYEGAAYLLSLGATDTYNVAGRMQAAGLYVPPPPPAPMVAQTSSTVMTSTNVMIGVGVAAAAGGGIALAAGGGGGGGGVASSGGGGGGGAGTHPETNDASDYTDSEGSAQEGVLTMNADDAYARGYDGRIFNRNSDGSLVDVTADGNVLVAVMDTGVDLDHPDLDANLRTDLSVTCNNSGCSSGGGDTDGHGTYVAGIIAAERNGVGMHGVAPNANIIAVGFADSGGNLTFGDIHGIRSAVNNGAQIINGSYGLQESTNNSLNIDEISPSSLNSFMSGNVGGRNYRDEYENAVSAGVIFVYSAGNDGSSQVQVFAGLPLYFQGSTAPAGIDQSDYNTVNPSGYDWSRHWVASIALDDDNTISSFSQRCGLAMEWCLAAPGRVASSTADGGGYASNINGTSFSAPNVTGAIAVMLGAFPQLNPDDALEIIFDTATDLGDPGTDAIYGRGLVNLDAATDPTTGGWTLSVSGAGSNTSSFDFGSSGFGMPSAFGNAVAASNAVIMFQDGYNKDYLLPLSSLAGRLNVRATSYDRFVDFAQPNYDKVMQVSEYAQLGFSAAPADIIPDKTEATQFGALSYRAELPLHHDMAELGFHYRANMANVMGRLDAKNLQVSDAAKNPYLNLADAASGSVLGYTYGNTRVRMAAYSGEVNGDRPEYAYRFGTEKNISGVMTEATYYSDDKHSHMSIEQGVMLEENSFLGAEASGAFGVDQATTSYAGLNGRYGVREDISLFANARIGMTNVEASNSSLFTDFDSLMTTSFALGAEANHVVQQGDVFGMMLSQPLRVNRGSANLTLPMDIASSGDIIYQNQRLNLAPKGREIDLEAYYQLAQTGLGDVSMNTIFRMNPENDNTLPNDFTVLGKYRLDF